MTCCLMFLAFGLGLIAGAVIINTINSKSLIHELIDAIKNLKLVQLSVNNNNGGDTVTTTKEVPAKPAEIPEHKSQQQVEHKEEKPNEETPTPEVSKFSKQYETKKDADGFVTIKIQFFGQYQGEDEDFTVCMKVKPVELTEEDIANLGGKIDIINKNYTKFMFKKLEQDQMEILDHEWGDEVHVLSYNSGNDVWEFKDTPDAASMSLDDEVAASISKDEPDFRPEISSSEHCIYNMVK